MSTTESVALEIAGLLDALASAYSAKLSDQAVELFTEDAVVVGTGADELRFGLEEVRAQIERDISQADALRASYGGLRVGSMGDVAWFYASLVAEVTIGEDEITMSMRFTATAVRSDQGWRVCQAHFSLPFAEQAEGESFAQPA